MLNITALYDSLSLPVIPHPNGAPTRDQSSDSTPQTALTDVKPIVTWKVTRFCNLSCGNCTSSTDSDLHGAELNTNEGMALIEDLARFGVSGLHLVGGEPLLRSDIFELIAYASQLGMQTSLHTNGTLLTLANGERLRGAGLKNVSILLEGVGRGVDRHRRAPGAYNAVLEAHANCQAAGLAAEIRTPLNRGSYAELDEILHLVEEKGIRKIVFAHQVRWNSGHASSERLTNAETREALDTLIECAGEFNCRGIECVIATDENHADAIYQYLGLAKGIPWRRRQLFACCPSGARTCKGLASAWQELIPLVKFTPIPTGQATFWETFVTPPSAKFGVNPPIPCCKDYATVFPF